VPRSGVPGSLGDKSPLPQPEINTASVNPITDLEAFRSMNASPRMETIMVPEKTPIHKD
jgi:hypothetical protein